MCRPHASKFGGENVEGFFAGALFGSFVFIGVFDSGESIPILISIEEALLDFPCESPTPSMLWSPKAWPYRRLGDSR